MLCISGSTSREVVSISASCRSISASSSLLRLDLHLELLRVGRVALGVRQGAAVLGEQLLGLVVEIAHLALGGARRLVDLALLFERALELLGLGASRERRAREPDRERNPPPSRVCHRLRVPRSCVAAVTAMWTLAAPLFTQATCAASRSGHRIAPKRSRERRAALFCDP